MPYDLKSLTAWASGLAWIYVAATVAMLAMMIFATELVRSIDTDGPLPAGATPEALYGVAAVYIVTGVAAIACYIVNAVWIYRASANAQAIDPDPSRIGPGWAVGWFAIPIAGPVNPA